MVFAGTTCGNLWMPVQILALRRECPSHSAVSVLRAGRNNPFGSLVKHNVLAPMRAGEFLNPLPGRSEIVHSFHPPQLFFSLFKDVVLRQSHSLLFTGFTPYRVAGMNLNSTSGVFRSVQLHLQEQATHMGGGLVMSKFEGLSDLVSKAHALMGD